MERAEIVATNINDLEIALRQEAAWYVRGEPCAIEAKKGEQNREVSSL